MPIDDEILDEEKLKIKIYKLKENIKSKIRQKIDELAKTNNVNQKNKINE